MIAQVRNSVNYSVQTPYIRPEAKIVYPINILNIQLRKGYISGYRWMNGCKGCQPGHNPDKGFQCKVEEPLETIMHNSTPESTEQQQKGVYNMSNCYKPACVNDYFNCDPRIFITWSGTDKNNKYMTSVNKSPTMFMKNEYASIWDSMVDANTSEEKNKQNPNTPTRMNCQVKKNLGLPETDCI